MRFSAFSPSVAVQALLTRAAHLGLAELNRTQVVKLLYFIDLEAVATIERPLSAIPWVWDRYGPFSHTISDALHELSENGTATRREEPTPYGNAQHLYALATEVATAPTSEMSEAALAIFDSVLGQHGSSTGSTLSDASYQTPPMLKLQQDGQRGDPVDVFVGSEVETRALRYLAATRAPDTFDAERAAQLYADAVG